MIKILKISLRIIVATVFILSAIAKLYPIESFEITFVELGFSNWFFSPFIARFIISLELFLGICILFNIWMQHKIYYLTQILLLLFTAYLLGLIIIKGNNVNCGCSGSYIYLSPLAAILKNMAMMFILFWIDKSYHHYTQKIIIAGFIIVAFTLPYILNPIGFRNVQAMELNQKMDMTTLPNKDINGNKIDYSHGNKIIVFLSATCSHCINTAKVFNVIYHKKKMHNLYFLIYGSKKEIDAFSRQSENKIPLIIMHNNNFFRYAGGRLPSIIEVENGILKKRWEGEFFDIKEVEKLLK